MDKNACIYAFSAKWRNIYENSYRPARYRLPLSIFSGGVWVVVHQKVYLNLHQSNSRHGVQRTGDSIIAVGNVTWVIIVLASCSDVECVQNVVWALRAIYSCSSCFWITKIRVKPPGHVGGTQILFRRTLDIAISTTRPLHYDILVGHVWDVMLVWSKGILNRTVFVLPLQWCTTVRAVIKGRSTISGFDLAWFSSLSPKRLCIFGLHGAMYIWFLLHYFGELRLEGLAVDVVD